MSDPVSDIASRLPRTDVFYVVGVGLLVEVVVVGLLLGTGDLRLSPLLDTLRMPVGAAAALLLTFPMARIVSSSVDLVMTPIRDDEWWPYRAYRRGLLGVKPEKPSARQKAMSAVFGSGTFGAWASKVVQTSLNIDPTSLTDEEKERLLWLLYLVGHEWQRGGGDLRDGVEGADSSANLCARLAVVSHVGFLLAFFSWYQAFVFGGLKLLFLYIAIAIAFWLGTLRFTAGIGELLEHKHEFAVVRFLGLFAAKRAVCELEHRDAGGPRWSGGTGAPPSALDPGGCGPLSEASGAGDLPSSRSDPEAR